MEEQYAWRIEFSDGTVLDEKDNEGETKVDPNNPGKKVAVIRWIPTTKALWDGFMPLRIDVPEGCLPVIVRFREVPIIASGTELKAGETITALYKLGYNFNGFRRMICVDVRAKEIFDVSDRKGCNS